MWHRISQNNFKTAKTLLKPLKERFQKLRESKNLILLLWEESWTYMIDEAVKWTFSEEIKT